LGEAINTSSHLPLRILALNVLREIALAHIDVCLFWSPELLDKNDPQPHFSFIADVKWLHETIVYLRDIDYRRAIPNGRYAACACKHGEVLIVLAE
jgi:hypothetical protein